MSKPIRVLHIGSGNLYGGVETLLVTLARSRNLCPEMEPVYTVCFEGQFANELRGCGVEVHSLGAVRVRNPISVLKTRRRLRELLPKMGIDVAICHSAWTQAIYGPVLRELGIPLLFWLHGAPTGTHWLERWAQLTPPDSVICNSNFTAGLLSKLDPVVRSEVVYCPVAAPSGDLRVHRETVRADLNTPADSVVIIQVARMEAWKGHRLLIDALNLVANLPGWTCWFVGGPQRREETRYFDSLQQTVRKSPIDGRVEFLGERSDTADLLAAADIFCQPNLLPEPFGIVFIEALWSGLPVVTTAMGAALEIVNPNCGALTPRGDAVALANVLAGLITGPDLRAKLSSGGPQRARELCEPAVQVRHIAQVVRRLTARKRAA